MSLFTELKRRSVFKLAAAYVVFAWLAVQVASIVLPAFDAPAGLLRAIILVLMLGFPLVLVLAWMFDLTPQGVRFEPDAAGGKLMFLIAIVLAAFALGWYFSSDLPDIRTERGHVRLAVLPLANLSPDPDNAFFADGLHDDLLTALSRLKDVDVISRTTMQTFRGSTLKLSEIAGEIDATHVIEGSVRRDAERIRLVVQLIDARTDDHLWAETYDRPLAEAPALQSIIAGAIAGVLGVVVSGTGTGAATTVMAAYDLYLKARLADGPGARVDALKLLDAALLLDPGFTLARAVRGGMACHVIWFDEARRAELAPQARADIVQARHERPDLVEADVADAFCTYYVEWNVPEALMMVESVLLRDPNHLDGLLLRAWLLRRLGRFEDALESLHRGFELDPNSPVSIGSLCEHMYAMRRYRELIGLLDAGLERLPGEQATFVECRIYSEYELTGDRERALAVLERLRGRISAETFEKLHEKLSMLGAEPTAARLAENAVRARDWATWTHGAVYPVALDLAMEADYLEDVRQRDRYIAEAKSMLATQAPAALSQPFARLIRARLLAFEGDQLAATKEVEQVLAESRVSPDPVYRAQVDWKAAYVLARAGAKSRSIDLLEGIHAAPFRDLTNADIRDDAYLRKLLGDQPRYQALMRKIAGKFDQGKGTDSAPR